MAISNGDGTFTKTFNTTLNNPYQLTYVSQQSVTNGSYLRRNGVSSSPHTETFQLPQNSWINLGSSGSGGFGGCNLLSNFDLGEFIIYDRKLSDKEIIDVENYLNKKWEIR